MKKKLSFLLFLFALFQMIFFFTTEAFAYNSNVTTDVTISGSQYFDNEEVPLRMYVNIPYGVTINQIEYKIKNTTTNQEKVVTAAPQGTLTEPYYTTYEYGCDSYSVCDDGYWDSYCASGHWESYCSSGHYETYCCSSWGCHSGRCNCGVAGNETDDCGSYSSTTEWVCDSTGSSYVCDNYNDYWVCTSSHTEYYNCSTGYNYYNGNYNYNVTNINRVLGQYFGGGTYQISTRAKYNTSEYSNWSTPKSITIIEDVKAPSVSLSPSNTSITASYNGSTNTSTGVTFTLKNTTTNQTLISSSSNKTGSANSTNLKPNTVYTFTAEAKKGNTVKTGTASIYTLANTPLSKGYDSITSNSVRLLWNSNSNPSNTNYHYEVRKKSDNSVVAQGTVNGTSVTVTGLTGGHEQYRYFVRAINGDGIYTDFTELIIPSLNVYQKSNYAKAEWAIEMENSDILTMTSFEDGQERPTLGWAGTNGGQSFTTETAYEGQYSVRIEDTYANGNHYGFPATSSNKSIMGFGRKYFPNGMDLSISFNAKSTGSGSFTPFGDGGWAETLLYRDNKVTVTAPKGSTKIKLDTLSGIYLGDYITTDTTDSPVRNMYQIRDIDTANNTITLHTGLASQLNVGEKLRYRNWRGAFNFGSRTVNSNQWTLFNINTKVSDYDDYDVLKRGGTFYINTWTEDVVYLDNLKFGYATKAELYRDGTKVYEGFLSDYDDYVAVDKVAPNPVSKINVANNGNTINVTFDTPSDKGTTYNYQLKAVKHNGDVIGSEVKPVTITSGIKGYSYVIDSIPSTTPDNIVDVTTPKINYTINPNTKNYIHIKVIDNEGNVSSVFHQEVGIPVLTATPNNQEDYIHLDWNINDTSKAYKYDVYKKLDGQSLYDKISSNNSNKTLNDYTGQDVAGPTKPTIIDARMINNGNTIHMEYTAAEDRGTKYYYYVEGTAPNTKVQSNIADATVKTGLKGYSIVVDQNPNTVLDNNIETTSLEYDINQRFYQKFYVHVAAVDNVGNISEVAHYECTDAVKPTLTVTGNPTEWTKENIILTAKATDNESGIRGIKLPNGEWVYSDTTTFEVSANGSYTFVAEDYFGNQTSVIVTVTKIDKIPPYNTSIIINNDDLYTNNRNVVLTISAQDNATGVSQMRFKTENSPWSAWVPYSTTFNYTMDAGYTHQGTNRVYVQFKDGVGNVGGDAFDSIVFDNIAPTGEIIYPKNTTNTRNINLNINAYDINPSSADIISGLNSVRFRELQNGVVKQDWTSWEQHNFTRNWILSDGDGVKVIEMEVRDNAGNIGKVTKSIVLDTLFIKDALFTDIVNPPLGNPELPTSEVIKVKKGYEFTFIVKTSGEPDNATYTFNGETGSMEKITDNLFRKTLKVDVNDESVNNEVLPINITVSRNDGAHKTTTLKVHIKGSAYDDYNINLTN